MATRRIGGPHTWPQRQLSYWLVPKRYKDGVQKHFLHFKEKVSRLQDSEKDRDHKDFIYYILRHNESKRLLTNTEIPPNSSLFIGAGSDTTSSVLTSSVYILATHPHVYATLAHEIRTACPTPGDITIAKIKALPYLSAFLSETMCMYSPLTTGMLRTVPKPLPVPRASSSISISSPKVEAATNSMSATAPFETYIDSHGPIPQHPASRCTTRVSPQGRSRSADHVSQQYRFSRTRKTIKQKC
ncbi:Cytochrome P450 [Rhypophila decipiens]